MPFFEASVLSYDFGGLDKPRVADSDRLRKAIIFDEFPDVGDVHPERVKL